MTELTRADLENLSQFQLFSIFLTQPEWKLCYSLDFVTDCEGYEDAYPLEQFASPGSDFDLDPLSWYEIFRRSVRYVSLGCRYEFRGLEVYDDYKILTRGKEPVCPGNAVYQAALGINQVDRRLALETGIALAERYIPLLPVDPMKEVLAGVEWSVRKTIEDYHADPELREGLTRWEKQADEALASMGIERMPGPGKTVH